MAICFLGFRIFFLRTQKVKVNDSLSTAKDLLSVVPQGSVLGPTLFLIYINDLLDLDIKNNVFLFADGVKIYNVSSEDHVLASEWSAKWQLGVSVEKCCVLHLGRVGQILPISNYKSVLCSEVKDVHRSNFFGKPVFLCIL